MLKKLLHYSRENWKKIASFIILATALGLTIGFPLPAIAFLSELAIAGEMPFAFLATFYAWGEPLIMFGISACAGLIVSAGVALAMLAYKLTNKLYSKFYNHFLLLNEDSLVKSLWKNGIAFFTPSFLTSFGVFLFLASTGALGAFSAVFLSGGIVLAATAALVATSFVIRRLEAVINPKCDMMTLPETMKVERTTSEGNTIRTFEGVKLPYGLRSYLWHPRSYFMDGTLEGGFKIYQKDKNNVLREIFVGQDEATVAKAFQFTVFFTTGMKNPEPKPSLTTKLMSKIGPLKERAEKRREKELTQLPFSEIRHKTVHLAEVKDHVKAAFPAYAPSPASPKVPPLVKVPSSSRLVTSRLGTGAGSTHSSRVVLKSVESSPKNSTAPRESKPESRKGSSDSMVIHSGMRRSTSSEKVRVSVKRSDDQTPVSKTASRGNPEKTKNCWGGLKAAFSCAHFGKKKPPIITEPLLSPDKTSGPTNLRPSLNSV